MFFTTIRYALLLFWGSLIIPTFGQTTADEPCATMPNLERLQQLYPEMQATMRRIEQHSRRLTTGVPKSRYSDAERIRIPVIVHIIYNQEVENLSDEVVHSQLEVLNRDFRRLNQDTINTPPIFAPMASDVGVEFCLANVDPNGFQTTGITRTYTSNTSFTSNDLMKFDLYGGKDAWDPHSYLNIWVCNLSGGTLGYAQFPGGPTETDGVVVDYLNFGETHSTATRYNLGRTATHEVGHWLNLRHIWGDGDCEQDDGVTDTPLAGEPNRFTECSFPQSNTCTDSDDLPDMFQNYMDYTADACMNLFTKGQAQRMRALFAPGGFRESLLYSNACRGDGLAVSCTDGFQNGDEQGIDCGGSSCEPCTPEYCTSAGDADYEWIESVQFSSIGTIPLPDFSLASGNDGGYGDHSNSTVFLQAGGQMQLELNPGFAFDSYPEHWKIWIDYNDNKNFDDPGELIFEADEVIGTVVADAIVLPDTVQGPRRLRISMNYTYFDELNGVGCGALTFGEVEDYTVTFTSCGKPSDLRLSEAPQQEHIQLVWDSLAEAQMYELDLHVVGEEMFQKFTLETTSTHATMPTLASESSYIFYYKIRAKCPQGWTGYTVGNVAKERNQARMAEANAMQVKVYPNPATDVLIVELENVQEQQTYSCQIVDALGKVVTEVVLPAGFFHQLDVSHLPGGMYHLVIGETGRRASVRFIK